jgi:recombination DNA repair RAD52 pathway protein
MNDGNMTMETPLTPEQLSSLHADLHPARVAKREQGRQTLSYLEAYDVKAMLIRVFGYAGFSADCLDAKIIREEQVKQTNSDRVNWKITAQATVRITIHQTGVTYTETAIAGSSQPDYTESADMAMKSAESDALKRAAIYLGTQFGLSLYQNGATRDIVRRVFAPDQSEATQLIVTARDDSNPGAQQAAAARLQRLQDKVNVRREPEDAPETPEQAAPAAADAPETPEQAAPAAADAPEAPEPAPKAPKAPKASNARQNAARKALADAETKAGLR